VFGKEVLRYVLEKALRKALVEPVARLCENSLSRWVRWDQIASVHLKILRMGN
jgi:hypothetical protein